jgi:uncharacterized protein YjbI with pentapeptide repeats
MVRSSHGAGGKQGTRSSSGAGNGAKAPISISQYPNSFAQLIRIHYTQATMNSRTPVPQLAKVVSILLLALFKSSLAAAVATNLATPNDKCEIDSSYTPISTLTVQEKVAHGEPVVLTHVLIDGAVLNLARRTVAQQFSLKASIVRSDLNFTDTVFSESFEINDTCVYGTVNAEGALFNIGLDWIRSVLRKPISFYAATVNGSITFDETLFLADADFSRARIKDGAYFTRAQFKGLANFIGTIVDYEGIFEATSFDSDAAFERAEFGGSAQFRERLIVQTGEMIPAARFKGTANFKATRVGGQANFIGVTFEKEVRMTGTRFDEALFWKAKFLSCYDVQKHSDCNDVMFNDAVFGLLDFGGDGMSADFGEQRKINMLGFTYHANRTPVGYMLKLLKRKYNREPYAYLEKLYRDKGDRDTADDIYFERRQAEGDLVAPYNFFRFGFDRVIRYVFGYGVRMNYPLIWIGILLFFCSLVLCRRDALESTDHRSMKERVGFAKLSASRRLTASVWESINLLVPKADLPGANRWRPSARRILLFSRPLPLTYKNLATSAKLTAWAIITVSVSLFSISDLIKN